MATAGSTKINIDLALNTKGFRPLGRINGQLGEFEKSLDASNARVLAFGASAGAILAVRKAFTATVKAAIEVQKSLKDINVILQATSGNLKKFGADLFKIASDTGQAFSVAAEAATELARQGLGVQETLKRTRDALILARLSGLGAAEAVNALTAALNTFTKVGLDSTAIINKLANVDAAFAVSSEDLAKALGRVGSAAVAAGVDLDQLLAIVTTAQQKTARGGAVIGNSFKTIFTRIQRPRVIKQLESLGVAVKGLEGETLPAMKVLENLAKTFDNLSQSQRAQISELVGGVFQVNVLKAALSDLSREQSIYNRALGISVGSSDQAIRRNEELNQTLAAQFQKTLNTFKEAAAELGTLTLAPAMENIFGAINKTFESAAGDSDLAKTGQLIGKSVFEAIGKFIGGPGLIIIGGVLFKTFATLATFAADAFKTLTGLNKNFQTQLNLQKQIFNVLSENPDLMNKIKNGTLQVEDAHDLVLQKINKETTALEKQLLVSNQIATQLTKSGVAYSGDFGMTAGGPKKFGGRRRGKSGGFIPNFARDDEVMGMMMGGYSSAQLANPKVRRDTIHNGRGGAFSAFTNGHEKVVDFTNTKGKKATAVIPPKGTAAWDDFMGALSGGYVPNFANAAAITKQIMSGKNPQGWNNAKGLSAATIAQANKNSAARKKGAATKKPKIVHPLFDAGQQYGMLGLFGNTDRTSTITSSTKDITRLKNRKGIPPSVQFSNFSQKSFEGGMKKQKTSYSAMVKRHMAKPMERLSNDFAQQMGLRDDAPRVTSANIGRRGNTLFPPGAEGAIFETTINALTKNAKSFEAGLAGDTSALWDFEESGNVDQRFKRKFGFSSGLKRADAKRSFSKEAINSIGNKMFSSLLKPDGSPVHRGNRLAVNMSNFAQNYPTMAKKGKAGGYIPNFNALHGAVMRERSAGIPSNRIRVGSSPSLASGMNPMGLGVWNTRDEPRGLSQGISRSFARGMNPKRAGIPNFAEAPDAGSKALDKSTAQMMKMSAIMMGLSTGISLLRNSVDAETSENHKLVSGLGALESAIMTVMMGSMMGGMFPKLDAMKFTSKSLPSLGLQNLTAKGMWSSTKSAAGSAWGGMKNAPGAAWSGMKGMAGKMGGYFAPTYTPGRLRAGSTAGIGMNPMPGGTLGPSRFTQGLRAAPGAAWSGMKSAPGMALKGAYGGLRGGIKGAAGGMMKGAAGMGALGTAAVGYAAYQGISTLANETFNSSFNELKESTSAFQKVSEEAEKNIGALTKFGDSAEQAAKVFHDSNSTMGQVMQAQKEMAKAAQSLPANIRSQIQGMIDPAQIQAAVQQGLEEQQSAKQNAQTRVDVAQATRDIRISDFGAFTKAKTEMDEARDLRQAKGVARTALGTLSDKDINALSGENLLKATEALASADSSEASIRGVDRALGNIGVDQGVIDALTKAMEEGDYAARQMAQGMLDQLLERRKLAQEEKAMAPAREAMIKRTREATIAIQEQKSALELEQKIRRETIKISSQAAGAFLSATGKIELGARGKIATQMEGSSAKFGTALSGTSRAFGATKLAGTGLGQAVQRTLMAASAGGVGSMNAKVVEQQTADLRAAAEQASGTEKTALENLASQLEALNGTSRLLFKENQKVVYETRAIAMAQKAAARQQQRLKSFGGSQAILDPSSLSGTINQITSGEMAMGMASRVGSRTGFNRANANRLAGMQDLLGGKLPEHLARQGRAAAEQVKLQDIRLMNQRFGMGLSEKDMRTTAKEQAAELFKSGNPIDRNNKGLESLNTTMTQMNNLLGAAQQNRMFIGGAEMQAAQQASQGYQDFANNRGNLVRGAGREFAGLQAYGGDVRNFKGAEAEYWGETSAFGFGPWMYGGSTQGLSDAGSQRQRGRANAMRMSNYNTSNSANTTNVYVNGISMQGDREQQRRMMQMMQYAAKYDPRLRQAIAQGSIPAGQGY